MKTFWKIAIGFAIGVVTTLFCLFVIALYINNKKEAIQTTMQTPKNYQYFELSTKSGIVRLHTEMPKDSVQILMGRPTSNDVSDIAGDVHETWEYLGRNKTANEFTIGFMNGKLIS
jgi:hypothetical protein